MDPQPEGSLARARRLWHGHTAVITGAGSGIGAGMAWAASRLGMTVVLADVSEARMTRVASRIHRAGGRAVVVPTDVTSLPAVEHLADVAFGDVGGVRLVANNAGVGHVGLLWEEPAASWHRLIDVNLHGVYHGIRAFVPRLVAAGEPAHVLNTASVGGLSTGAYHGGYQVTKHAVLAISECLAADLATVDAPVHVSVALPGPVDTRIFTDANAHTAGSAVVEGQLQAMRTMLAERGMTADEAGARLLAQVAEGRFWVTTHPGMVGESAARRAERLLVLARSTADL
jgi:NAD(P)-dependent dehydrogenase (short-subunit alcohol dehydrogenase family)